MRWSKAAAVVKGVVSPVAIPLLRAWIRYTPPWVGKTRIAYRLLAHMARRAELQPLPERIVRTVYGVRMEVRPPDLIQSMIFLTGRWEPQASRYIAAVLRSDDIFVDIGANVGHHALLAASRIGPAGRVYAFEASPTIYAKLLRNLELNGFTNVTAVNAAVSAEKGELAIWLGRDWNLGRSTTVADTAGLEDMTVESTVTAERLDRLIDAKDLLRARLIKIDVEGAERRVLEPIRALLPAFAQSTEWLVELAAEYLPGKESDVAWIYNAFAEAGYSAYTMPNDYGLSNYLRDARPVAAVRLTQPPGARFVDVLFSRSQPTEV